MPTYSGRTCFGILDRDLRAKAQFVTTEIADHYDALKLTVLNRGEGPVDTLEIRLKDLWGMKPVPQNPRFRDGIAPHIWDHEGEAKWYIYQPTEADRKLLQQTVAKYLNMFRRSPGKRKGPQMVYICAPFLRGDVLKSIKFAREKAREVFRNGNIPICPPLMLLPVTDAKNFEQDTAAQKAGLQLMELCQQVNIYGREWTAEMWAEIRHAMDLDISIISDETHAPNEDPI